MDALRTLTAFLLPALPMGVALLLIALVFLLVHRLFERRLASKPNRGFQRQLIMLALTLLATLVVIIVSPLSDAQKGQLISLVGLLLSAAIALSSATILGNAMAGIMMRAVRSFRMGDFIRVGEHFGRVSERGLFHTEIQTEERDLTTLPNLYLVTHPVKVLRSSGTMIHAEVSLGYDVSRQRIHKLLIEAATAAGLEEAYVHVRALGDFSVVYRVNGLLVDVKRLLSAQSKLKEMMLDHLHEGGVEIVSPSFMNQRPLRPEQVFIPRTLVHDAEGDSLLDTQPESLVFDKADEAESAEALKIRHEKMVQRLKQAEEDLKACVDETEREQLARLVERLGAARDKLAAMVQERLDKLDD